MEKSFPADVKPIFTDNFVALSQIHGVNIQFQVFLFVFFKKIIIFILGPIRNNKKS